MTTSIIALEDFQHDWEDAFMQLESSYIKYLYDDKLLTEKEFNITKAPMASIRYKIASGQWTATETLIAFVKKSIINHKVASISSVKDAILRAQYLDWYYKTHGKTVGPLHGLPIAKPCATIFKESYGDSSCDTGAIYVEKLDICVEFNIAPDNMNVNSARGFVKRRGIYNYGLRTQFTF
ncbi:uncharacterized protein RJT20DRAFT_136679 [Scheffersomyces xylosifermentans]|uniref:uncharacterized protein n=1 Tax=Scheffersomyces xylosifermentans TaxID=1304137 RepID=UPI00315D2495